MLSQRSFVIPRVSRQSRWAKAPPLRVARLYVGLYAGNRRKTETYFIFFISASAALLEVDSTRERCEVHGESETRCCVPEQDLRAQGIGEWDRVLETRSMYEIRRHLIRP